MTQFGVHGLLGASLQRWWTPNARRTQRSRWTATFVLEKPAASKQSLSSGIPAFIGLTPRRKATYRGMVISCWLPGSRSRLA
jgi:hypothetical protein